LVARRSRFRLRRYGRSSFIYVRELVQGVQVREFSLAPLQHRRDEDVERARDLCLEGHRKGQWPAPPSGRSSTSLARWEPLAQACIADIELRICKEGSRVHAVNDLKLRVARFRDPADPQQLLSWAMEVNPLSQLKRFNRRIETISQIHRSGLMDLTAVLQQLRGMRPKGAAEKIRKASSMRVRVIPADADLEHWLDRLEPFHQWVFACIAVFGLRPHELWHAEGIDARGGITIPGDMKTKTSEHFAPAVPHAWLERYQLRQNWDRFHAQLNGRWTVRFSEISGVRIAVNNVAVTNALYKEFQRKGLQKLGAPLAEGDGMDWVRPYDLRHAYAIRCATSEETADAFDDDMAAWMGHGLEIHRRVYLRWMSSSRKKESMQRRRGGSFSSVVPSVVGAALPQGITPELIAMAMKLKAAGIA
jgi:integrase